jgi:regulator of RNase E activity RraA
MTMQGSGSMQDHEKIIDFIRRNRVSSTEVADCLGKTGALPGPTAVNRGHFAVGRVFWAYCYGATNWHLHEQLQGVEAGDVVLVQAFECEDRALFGDIVAKYLLLYRQAAAVVVSAKLRDAPRLIKENWPLWCEGFTPVGCFNHDIGRDLSDAVVAERKAEYAGTVAVCDDTGVTVIPESLLNEEFLGKLQEIEALEDTWYECIDRRGWSTFETICLKKYENEEDP